MGLIAGIASSDVYDKFSTGDDNKSMDELFPDSPNKQATNQILAIIVTLAFPWSGDSSQDSSCISSENLESSRRRIFMTTMLTLTRLMRSVLLQRRSSASWRDKETRKHPPFSQMDEDKHLKRKVLTLLKVLLYYVINLR